MYESMTYEIILQQMLDAVIADNENVDTREGSIIYTALAPAAIEMQNMYIALDVILEEAFADTQSREYLIKRAAERGITPSEASFAVIKGEFNIDIPIGSRFTLGDQVYAATESISTGIFKMTCETAGEVGNDVGTLLPIEYISGLTSAALTEILILGEDEEATEDLRSRYFESLDSQSYGGNVSDYKEKTNEIGGVGGVKVYPVWNGGGTVKLVITDSTYGVPSGTLIDAVQTLADPVVNAGEGDGFAPIGHVVTVAGVTSLTINIGTTITYESGYVWADVEAAVQAAIDAYFLELGSDWDGEEYLVVRISQIETRLLNLTGIIDISGTTINAASANLSLGADVIPVRGTVVDNG